jgi:hypothetical protein
MHANHSHSYTHLILAWVLESLQNGVLLLHQASGIHDIGRATCSTAHMGRGHINRTGATQKFAIVCTRFPLDIGTTGFCEHLEPKIKGILSSFSPLLPYKLLVVQPRACSRQANPLLLIYALLTNA